MVGNFQFKVPKPGRYRHFKGKEYFVIGLVRHSESLEWLVLYRQDYGQKELWVRPLANFMENVTIDGVARPRFEFLAEQDPELVI